MAAPAAIRLVSEDLSPNHLPLYEENL
jgi:hypothetical protein